MNFSKLVTIFLSVLFLILIYRVFKLKADFSKTINNSKITDLNFSCDTTYYLGSIEHDSILPFSFYIRNKGSNTLFISKLHTSCGCTSIESDNDSARARDSIKVSGIISSKGKSGINLTVLNFIANTKEKNHQLRLKYFCK